MRERRTSAREPRVPVSLRRGGEGLTRRDGAHAGADGEDAGRQRHDAGSRSDRSAAAVAEGRPPQRRADRHQRDQLGPAARGQSVRTSLRAALLSERLDEPGGGGGVRSMRILTFTGGAGSMFCGSCLRDNALAAELLRRGHDVLLSPVYTPTRTDEKNVSADHVFFGGISVYLEQHSALFRHTPRFVDKLWDSSWALKMATKRQIKVDAKSLGEMTVSMLRGERGYQAKEIEKLLEWLRTEPKFDVINLPYSLLLGLVAPIKRALQAPVCVTLQGDDLFLDGLREPYRAEAMDLIHKA